MKKLLLNAILMTAFALGNAENTRFFLSSETIVQAKQGSLKNLSSFVFFPLLKIEQKESAKIMELIEQELKKAGKLVKEPVLTSDGADLSTFSNPTLRFTIEQLVDQNNELLPVLNAILSVKTGVEISKNKEYSHISINRWSTYIKKTDNIETAIKTTLPLLLKKFLNDFQSANNGSQSPTLYISYDASWWRQG